MKISVSDNRRYIPFENLRNRGVQKEKSENYNISFFKEVFHQTAGTIKTIIEANRGMRYTDDSDFSQRSYNVQNIIAFTGRKGTGKTSTMLSCADFLAAPDSNAVNEFEEITRENEFFVLQYVDSSAISEKEDFFELLLFRMKQYLSQRIESTRTSNSQKLRSEFDPLQAKILNVFNHYSSINSNNFDNSASSIQMEKIISRHDVRREFCDLISDYNSFLLSLTRNNKRNGYMVLCIDDLDMFNQKHISLLNCLHQYFMVPGVIVFITAHFPALTANVLQDFYSSMDISNSEEKINILALSKRQTYEYLSKIIPIDMRISMPSWRKYDYMQLSTTSIVLYRSNNESDLRSIYPALEGCEWCINPKDHAQWFEYIGGCSSDTNGKELLTVHPKLFIMRLLADRTKIYLDTEGYKLHFMEPDSLRSLLELFYLFYNMENINDDLSYAKIEYNRKVLLDYLYFKLIPEFHLSNEEYDLINMLQSEPMGRRGMHIWEYYFSELTRNMSEISSLYGVAGGSGTTSFAKKEKNKHRIDLYNFGEMFRCLYYGSRLSLFSKNFVKAVLASYAFSMPQLIELEKKKKRLHDSEQLCMIFKNSIMGDEICKKIFDVCMDNLDADIIAQKLTYKDSKKLLLEKIQNELFESNNDEVIKKAEFFIEKFNFYDFNVYNNVFQNSLLGYWNNDLFCQLNNKKLQVNVKSKDLEDSRAQKTAEMLVDFFLCIVITNQSPNISFHGDLKGGGVYIRVSGVKLDPTVYFVGSMSASHILKYNFYFGSGTKESNMLNILGIFGKEYEEKYGFKNSFVRRLYSEIFSRYFDSKPYYSFLLKNTDITYSLIKRVVSKKLYLSDNNLQINKSMLNDDIINCAIPDFLKEFNLQMEKVLADYELSELKQGNILTEDRWKEIVKNLDVKYV